MSIWFDTTDIWDWREPQLTGIQRVVATVLGVGLRERDDLRLLRFDRPTQRFWEIGPDDLPPAVRRYGGIDAAPAAPETRRNWLRFLRLGGGPDAQGRAPKAIGFSGGDTIVSLSLTWGYEGYWDAIDAAKAAGVRLVQLVHDLAPILQPQWLPPDWKTMAVTWFEGVATRADVILTVSRFQRGEIEGYLASAGLGAAPVRVVRLGDDPPRLAAQSLPSPSERERGPFVLCVSGFYPRKNHEALYEAWRELVPALGEACPMLLLVGDAPRLPLELLSRMAEDPLTKGRIRVRHDVTDEALAGLYRDCLFTVYPSHYEGWGLPIAESLRFGRYCIAGAAEAFPEVGGDLIDYASDGPSLLAAVRRGIEDPAYVASREAGIRARYRPRGWREAAGEIFAYVDPAAVRRAG